MSFIQQSTITLPEINISNELDWDEHLETTSPPPTPPVHQPPKEEKETDSDNESITTGLTRALSLPRQLNTSTTTTPHEEENIRKEVINISTSNPSHLFWVPASQHPEIAPAEFEKYVDTHGLMIRKKSVKRRQSILSVYFTANDQQKLLDDLAKMDTDRQAALNVLEQSQQNSNSYSSDEDSHKRKLVMRRSVSLHLPTAGDYVRNVPDLLVFDRNSSPLDESRALVPKGDRPLLRRGARTNFKRNSSVTAPINRPVLRNRKSESDYHKQQQEEKEIESTPITRSSSADGGVTLSDGTQKEKEEEPLSPVAETSEDVRDLCIATRENSIETPPIIMSRSASTSTATSSSSRKSSWSWAFWSDEKSSKKNNKIDPVITAATTMTEEPTAVEPVEPLAEAIKISTSTDLTSTEKERGKRFTLSSLFTRKSKHQTNNNTSVHIFNTTNNLNAAPKDFQLNRMFMTRLPLHVERAIYKLSHIKLANPRRPLHEQVLISNQMFWYLSVIAANPPPQQHTEHTQQPLPQQKKKPKRLVKKHRPPPPQQQQKKPPLKKDASKLNGNVVGGFMATNTGRESSTGFVVPDNYLNPKYPSKKKSSNVYSKAEWDHKQSDSSSEEEDEDIISSDEEELQKEDDIPLGLWKR